MVDKDLKMDKELKEILGHMGLIMNSLESSVKKIEKIQRIFLGFFLLDFAVSLILGFIFGILYITFI